MKGLEKTNVVINDHGEHDTVNLSFTKLLSMNIYVLKRLSLIERSLVTRVVQWL